MRVLAYWKRPKDITSPPSQISQERQIFKKLGALFLPSYEKTPLVIQMDSWQHVVAVSAKLSVPS